MGYGIFTHNIRWQSIKKPNLWNSEPSSMCGMRTMVALCSGDFKLNSDTSSIMPLQVVIELHAHEWVCVWYPQRFFASCKMKDLEEQHVCIKFCFKLANTFMETIQMLQQAYGEDCLSHTQCHEWYQCFKSGRTSFEDNPKSGRPSTSMDDDHVGKVLAVIH